MEARPITLINVFDIDADDVDHFLEEWRKRAQDMGRQPGFRSLRLHRALDPDSRFQVVNVAEWDSVEALQAAMEQNFFQKSVQRSKREFAVAAHPAIYRVVVETTAE